MYKSTRHTNKMWTYAATSLGPYVGFGENHAGEIISKCRSALIACGVLRLPDFETFQPGSGSLANVQFVNGRLRSGHAYLRKVGIPLDVLSTIPNWLTIAPKLGKVLHNLALRNASEIEVELYQLHRYLQEHIVSTRPQFSNLAKRVEKVSASTPVKKPLIAKRKVAKPPLAAPRRATKAPLGRGVAEEAQRAIEAPPSSESSNVPLPLALLVASAGRNSSKKEATSMALALLSAVSSARN